MKLDSPTEYAKDKVEHEERSDNDERHEEGPVEHVSNCIVCLKRHVFIFQMNQYVGGNLNVSTLS